MYSHLIIYMNIYIDILTYYIGLTCILLVSGHASSSSSCNIAHRLHAQNSYGKNQGLDFEVELCPTCWAMSV